jgi:hypothetical protein
MNKVIMHKNCMDVAFDCYKLRRYKPGHVDLKGRWINLGYVGKPYVISNVVKFRITEKQFQDWVDITSNFQNKRNNSGLPCL